MPFPAPLTHALKNINSRVVSIAVLNAILKKELLLNHLPRFLCIAVHLFRKPLSELDKIRFFSINEEASGACKNFLSIWQRLEIDSSFPFGGYCPRPRPPFFLNKL